MRFTIAPPWDQAYSDVKFHDHGGQAEIFSATYVPTGEHIALKVLKPLPGSAKKRSEERFLAEARTLRKVNHPNVVRVFEVLEDLALNGEPTKAFAMEWVESNLEGRLVRNAEGLGRAVLEKWLEQALQGLAALHGHQIAVRDLRPANVLLSESEDVKLADLGLARTEESAASLVESSRYVAPEILDGTIRGGRREDPPPEAYFASDLYSLGFIFYEAAVGVERWESLPALESVYGRSGVGSGLDGNQRWREWHLDRGKRLPPVESVRRDVDPRLVRVLNGLVDKDRNARCSSVAEALELLGSGERRGGTEVPVPPPRREGWLRRLAGSRGAQVAGGIAAVAVAVWVGAEFFGDGDGGKQATPVERAPAVQTVSQGVRSEPAGAELFVDGQRRGQTPMVVDSLAVGRMYRFAVRLEGYVDWERVVQADTVGGTLEVVLARRPGERREWKISGETFAFRWIPAGRFVMGSPPDEPCRDDDEVQHAVVLTKGFWMQETEVTQAQWEAVMGSNPSFFKGPNLPVEQVNWSDVEGFLEKLNAQGNGRYRLPTEAEWEYAARAGSDGPFGLPCSDYSAANCAGQAACVDRFAWYAGNSGGTTHPVGLKRGNAWGLYDMSGNVWEWVRDWYGEYATGTVTDPKGPRYGENRVLRGGTCDGEPWIGRAASRLGAEPAPGYVSYGFRCVRDSD